MNASDNLASASSEVIADRPYGLPKAVENLERLHMAL